MNDLVAKELAKGTFQEWDTFCSKSDDGSFWHTTDWLAYSALLRPHLKSNTCSFMMVKNGEVFAICPLIAELNEDGVRQFSFGGLPTPLPALRSDLSREKRERVLHLALQHIDILARELKVSRSIVTYPALSPSYLGSFHPYNQLTKYGYVDVSRSTQIIDLSLDAKRLLGDISKGHNYDIDKGKKECTVKIYTKENITKEIFDGYRVLHHKAAGRVTRPLETFEMMYTWMTKGSAFLVGAIKEKRSIAYSFCTDYKKTAYYGSSCADPSEEFAALSSGHSIQWRTIEWLKQTGHTFYEIGWQQFGPLLHDFPSQKEINIAHFKRGFGGYTVPLFIGEKYYSRDYFNTVYSERTKKYAQTIKDT